MIYRHPVVKLSNNSERIKFLETAHALGFSYEPDLATSMRSMRLWTPDLQSILTHGSLRIGAFTLNRSRIVTWLTQEDARLLIGRGDYTLVNSIDHIKGYIIRNKKHAI